MNSPYANAKWDESLQRFFEKAKIERQNPRLKIRYWEESEKIIEPLLSRFLVLEVPEYSFEEFTEIAISRLAEEKFNRHMAAVIAEKVWTLLGSRDIRDVIKVARLVTNQEDIHRVIGIMNRYSKQDNLANS